MTNGLSSFFFLTRKYLVSHIGMSFVCTFNYLLPPVALLVPKSVTKSNFLIHLTGT